MLPDKQQGVLLLLHTKSDHFQPFKLEMATRSLLETGKKGQNLNKG